MNKMETEADFGMSRVFEDLRYPCWFVRFESSPDRNKSKWIVGVIFDRQKKEYSFNLSLMGDLNDLNFWNRLISLDFALDLLDKYKKGGEAEVKLLIERS
jgi:hypothetical protein